MEDHDLHAYKQYMLICSCWEKDEHYKLSWYSHDLSLRFLNNFWCLSAVLLCFTIHQDVSSFTRTCKESKTVGLKASYSNRKSIWSYYSWKLVCNHSSRDWWFDTGREEVGKKNQRCLRSSRVLSSCVVPLLLFYLLLLVDT